VRLSGSGIIGPAGACLKFIEVNQMDMFDMGGRRLKSERRQYSYAFHLPERRSGNERRCGNDRRSGMERRSPDGFRAMTGMDRRSGFQNR